MANYTKQTRKMMLLAGAVGLSIHFMAFKSSSLGTGTCEESTINGKRCFTKVQTPPTYRGGEKEMEKYIRKASKELLVNYKGKRVSAVQLIVDASGQTTVVSVNAPTDNAAMRKRITKLVEGMHWNPGKCEGFNVNSLHTVNINY